MKRRKRLKQRRSKPRRSLRKLWPEYLEAVRGLPCYVCGWDLCHVDPDHMGPRPYGRKADDDTAVPMCRYCHRYRTDGNICEPDTRQWVSSHLSWVHANKDVMREWCDRAIAATRAIVLPMLGASGGGL